jgi:antitoxin (DNA-binding transcriptional repressor) of toxin-antitoxin stability system
MATFHISVAEAGDNFALLMNRVRAGNGVVLKDGSAPIAFIRPADLPRGRPLSESLAMAEARSNERGYDLVMDPEFAADRSEIVANRKPRDTSARD